MKNIILMLTLLLFIDKILAQDIESQLYSTVCNGILKTDSFVKARAKMQGTHILLDPLTDSAYIEYPDKPWNSDVQWFKKQSRDKQIAILTCDSIPVLPLRNNDTIYIIDTTYLFSKGELLSRGVCFKLLSSESEIPNRGKKMFIHSVVIRDDDIILSLTFPSSDLLYSVQVRISNHSLSLMKMSTLNLRSLKQHMNR